MTFLLHYMTSLRHYAWWPNWPCWIFSVKDDDRCLKPC